MILLWFYFSGLLDRYVYSFLAVRSGYMLSTAEFLTGTDTVNAKYSSLSHSHYTEQFACDNLSTRADPGFLRGSD